MLSSLQPMKRDPKANDSLSAAKTTAKSTATRGRPSKPKTTTRQKPIASTDRPAKRQKLSAAQSSSDPATRPKPPSSKARASATKKQPPKKTAIFTTTSAPPPRQTNTIDRYFTPSDSYLSDEQEKPRDSLYDAIQKTVHEAETKSEDKRTLRSQDDSSRLKSGLSIYFPNYDSIINDTPEEHGEYHSTERLPPSVVIPTCVAATDIRPELITPDTIFIIRPNSRKKDTQTGTKTARNADTKAQSKHQRAGSGHAASQMVAHSSSHAGLNGAQKVDFSIIAKSVDTSGHDPLTDDVYFKAHRRAERKEKQLRNIEKERAMHEKVQLERLLDGLQGYDWLRVMGVTGITDTEAQKYQSKREYFIREVKALVLKFQEWREEEKRQKTEKPANNGKRGQDADEELEQDERESREPSSSDNDASAARQLQREASGSAKVKIRQRINAHVAPIIFRAPTPEGPFTSFFDKPHLRDAALGKNRHGRTMLAFGHPVPELEERDFELPAEYTTPESLKESARRRRIMKRESIVNSKAKK